MSFAACAGFALLATVALFVVLFVLGACRLSGIADDTAEQVIRQLSQGDAPAPPDVQTPFHLTGYTDGER